MKPKKPTAVVLDSWAVIAYLEDERASENVANIIANAHEDGVQLLISVINAVEVWYIVAREVSVAEADKSIKQLRGLSVEFVDADWTLAKEAGRFKSANKMSLADAYAAALAKQQKASLATGDPEFKQIEKEISIAGL
ncbi:MAG: PIN domain-containing protein [Pyrinomonadaceae bacterium]